MTCHNDFKLFLDNAIKTLWDMNTNKWQASIDYAKHTNAFKRNPTEN